MCPFVASAALSLSRSSAISSSCEEKNESYIYEAHVNTATNLIGKGALSLLQFKRLAFSVLYIFFTELLLKRLDFMIVVVHPYLIGLGFRFTCDSKSVLKKLVFSLKLLHIRQRSCIY